jgi:hypothetical protein
VRRVIASSAKIGTGNVQAVKFLNSNEFRIAFDSVARVVQETREGMVKERQFHENDWRKRDANNNVVRSFLEQINEALKPPCRIVSAKAA